MIDILDILSPRRPFVFETTVVVPICLHANVSIMTYVSASVSVDTYLDAELGLC